MDPSLILLAFIVGYLCGAISFTRLITRRIDPHTNLDDVYLEIKGMDEPMKMHAMSANTASMKYGSKVGCTIGALDMLKVFIPTLVIRLLYPGQNEFLIVAIAGMIGHNWPVFYRFKGGRGISAFYGGLLAVDPIGAVVTSIIGMGIGMSVFKDFLVSYLAGLWLILPWLWFTSHNPYYPLYGLAANLLFLLAMIPEIRDIIRLRKQYGKGELRSMMNGIPMGSSMLKIMDHLGMSKKST
ncbi:MAG: glycerol-3-phosphate acyltransferase [Anaerolineales bacterium]|jgi:glycerol-3-phosphate acyltransferase PlsY